MMIRSDLSSLSRRSFLGLVGAGAGALTLGVSGCGTDQGSTGGLDQGGELDVWVLQDEAQNAVQARASESSSLRNTRRSVSSPGVRSGGSNFMCGGFIIAAAAIPRG